MDDRAAAARGESSELVDSGSLAGGQGYAARASRSRSPSTPGDGSRDMGAARGLRSPDLQFTKLPLCRAELWRHGVTAVLRAVRRVPLEPLRDDGANREEKVPRHKDSEPRRKQSANV